MNNVYSYELIAFGKSIIASINPELIDTIDPELLKEFNESLKSISMERWNIIKDKFNKKLEYLATIDEVLVFTILVAKMDNTFLDIDSMYLEELISSLLVLDIDVIDYTYYTKVLTSKKFYSIIMKLSNKKDMYKYFEYIKDTINILEDEELDEEYALRVLYKYMNKPYSLLIEDDDTIYTVYTKIRNKMIQSNKEYMVYTSNDFKVLDILLRISNEDEYTIIKILQDIDKTSFSVKEIIDRTLDALINYSKVIPFTRRRYDKKK